MKNKKTKIPGGKNKLDTLLKIIFSKKENFASIFNTLVFGKNELEPENLKERDSVEKILVKMPDGTQKTIQLCRDVTKLYDGLEKFNLCIYGMENQDKIDYTVPLRNMFYDCAAYLMQVDFIKHENDKINDYADSGEFLSKFQKNDKIIPVFTVIIYYGEKDWDGAKTLKEMMNPLPEPLDALVQDYHCHIIEVRKLSDNKINDLSRELRQLFGMLVHSGDNDFGEYAKKNQDLYNNVSDEVALAMSELSNNNKFKQYINNNTDKGGVNMSSVFFENWERTTFNKGVQQGIQQGIQQGVQQGIQQGIQQNEAKTAWQFHNRAGMSIHDLHMTMEKPEFEIEKLINYWQEHLDSEKTNNLL